MFIPKTSDTIRAMSMPDEATNFFHAVIVLDKGCFFGLEDGSRLTPTWSVLSPALYLYRALCPSHYTLEWDGFAKLTR